MRLFVLASALCLIASAVPHRVLAQGRALEEGGHYLAALDLLGNLPDNTRGRVQVPFAASNPQFPPNYYEENGISVERFINRAVLVTEWWTLFGEPVENYAFQWWRNESYHVRWIRPRVNSVTVTRAELTRYPDLLRRFDALKPLDATFEVYWELLRGSQRRSYGSTMPYLNVFRTTVSGLLVERSGQRPLSVPGIRPGAPATFLTAEPSAELRRYAAEIARDFADMRQHDVMVTSFHATQIRWPVAEMKAIAERLLEYRANGYAPASPREVVQSAERQAERVAPYPRADEWATPVDADEGTAVEAFTEGAFYGVRTQGREIFRARFPSGWQSPSIRAVAPGSRFFAVGRREVASYKPLYLDEEVSRLLNHRGQTLSIDGHTEFRRLKPAASAGEPVEVSVLITPPVAVRRMNASFGGDTGGDDAQLYDEHQSMEAAVAAIRRARESTQRYVWHFGVVHYRRYSLHPQTLAVAGRRDVFLVVNATE